MARCSHKFRASLRFIVENLGGISFVSKLAVHHYTRIEAPEAIFPIGLRHINWRFWGPRSGVASRSDLLDPRRNLELGGAILKDGLNRGGRYGAAYLAA